MATKNAYADQRQHACPFGAAIIIAGPSSIAPGSGQTVAHVTIQNRIVGQSLNAHNHSAGGLIQPTGGVSILRSLYIDNKTRNPKVKRGRDQVPPA